MARIGVNVSGVSDTRQELARIERAAGRLASKPATAIIAARTRQIAPSSGRKLYPKGRRRLRNAVKIVRPGRVGLAVPFASYFHWGTTRQKAQPIIRIAAEQTESQWVPLYDNAMQQVIDRQAGRQRAAAGGRNRRRRGSTTRFIRTAARAAGVGAAAGAGASRRGLGG